MSSSFLLNSPCVLTPRKPTAHVYGQRGTLVTTPRGDPVPPLPLPQEPVLSRTQQRPPSFRLTCPVRLYALLRGLRAGPAEGGLVRGWLFSPSVCKVVLHDDPSARGHRAPAVGCEWARQALKPPLASVQVAARCPWSLGSWLYSVTSSVTLKCSVTHGQDRAPARLPGEAAHQHPIPCRTFPALCVVRDANIQCACTHTHTHTYIHRDTNA